ncbi:MAG: transglutaminase-like cysteine peptidase [Erythrobacter sp.]
MAQKSGMLKKPLLAATALLGVSMMPTQAAAAPLALSVPSAMPMVAFGMSQINCAPTQATAATARPAYRSRSAAVLSSSLLGGRPSALERLRMQQSGQAQPAQTAASLTPAVSSSVVPVAAVGFACPTMQAPSAAVTGRIQTTVTGTFMGTERVRIGKTRFDAKWNRVVDRGLSSRDLTATLGAVPSGRDALLSKVNAWVNRSITYKDDRGGDAWASAKETLSKRAGDCEDYAILKMQMLHAAGIAKKDLMLTLARDNMAGNDHAVLLVRTEGHWVMLDMGSDRVVPAAGDYGYRPVMSFAGNSRYLHGKKYNPNNARNTTIRLASAS